MNASTTPLDQIRMEPEEFDAWWASQTPEYQARALKWAEKNLLNKSE